MTEPSGNCVPRIVRASRLRLSAALVVGAAVLAGCSASQFRDDDEVDVAPDTSVIKSIMTGMGAVDPVRKPVTVEPRAPLAIPPDRTRLPPPEDAAQVAAAGAGAKGAFPVNPEDARRQMILDGQAKEAAREEGDRLSQSELQAGRIAGAGQGLAETPIDDLKRPVTPDKLKGTTFKAPDGQPMNADGSPKRRSLTEPPTAYRTPASTAPMPTGDEPTEKKWYKPGTWFNGVRNRHDDMPTPDETGETSR